MYFVCGGGVGGIYIYVYVWRRCGVDGDVFFAKVRFISYIFFIDVFFFPYSLLPPLPRAAAASTHPPILLQS